MLKVKLWKKLENSTWHVNRQSRKQENSISHCFVFLKKSFLLFLFFLYLFLINRFLYILKGEEVNQNSANISEEHSVRTNHCVQMPEPHQDGEMVFYFSFSHVKVKKLKSNLHPFAILEVKWIVKSIRKSFFMGLLQASNLKELLRIYHFNFIFFINLHNT